MTGAVGGWGGDCRQGRMRYAPTGEVGIDEDGRDYAALSGRGKRVVV